MKYDVLSYLNSAHKTGEENADTHFLGFWKCAIDSLPAVFHNAVPARRVDVNGVFTSSTRQMIVACVQNIPNYWDIDANFELKDSEWSFTGYTVTLDSMRLIQFKTMKFEDAAMMSRYLQCEKNKGATTGDFVGGKPIVN